MRAIDLAQAVPVAHADLPNVSGCYVLVADPEAMRELGFPGWLRPNGALRGEVGRQHCKRVSRTHLLRNRTGSSTLRRSIGALLRVRLDLQPQSLSPKRTEKDIQNYKFDSTGETRLTEWIATNLGVISVESPNPKATEGNLITDLQPLLNLRGWANRYREHVGTLAPSAGTLPADSHKARQNPCRRTHRWESIWVQRLAIWRLRAVLTR